MKEIPEGLKQELRKINMNHRRSVEEAEQDAEKISALVKDYPEWKMEIELSARNLVILSQTWNEFMQKGVLAE